MVLSERRVPRASRSFATSADDLASVRVYRLKASRHAERFVLALIHPRRRERDNTTWGKPHIFAPRGSSTSARHDTIGNHIVRVAD